MSNTMLSDSEFIQDPKGWPRWPILPMESKKLSKETAPLIGLMVAELKPKVYEINFYDLHSGHLFEQLKSVKVHEYQTFEALLLDWEIDN